jgi:hypothetical protein
VCIYIIYVESREREEKKASAKLCRKGKERQARQLANSYRPASSKLATFRSLNCEVCVGVGWPGEGAIKRPGEE